MKRDGQVDGRIKVMHSWNLSALGLELVESPGSLADSLASYFEQAAESIGEALTEDPSPVIVEPLALPDGITQEYASRRLGEMGSIVRAAIEAQSQPGARLELEKLFGAEIEAIRAREHRDMKQGLADRDRAAVASALGVTEAPKATRSYRER